MEPTTTAAAAIIVSIKAWCAVNGVSVGLSVITKLAFAYLTGGLSAARDVDGVPPELLSALESILS